MQPVATHTTTNRNNRSDSSALMLPVRPKSPRPFAKNRTRIGNWYQFPGPVATKSTRSILWN
jgi:hypothetical protein